MVHLACLEERREELNDSHSRWLEPLDPMRFFCFFFFIFYFIPTQINNEHARGRVG